MHSFIPTQQPHEAALDADGLAMLIIQLERLLEQLGKATRFRLGNLTVWEIHSPELLGGMRAAAELSLKQDGEEDVQGAIAAALGAYPSSPFLALRSLLNEEVLTRLVERFEREVSEMERENL
ncbi:MAG: hypothetical protein AAGA46_00025 [Cyanobacteria bacterium P01_F01_bin.13]